jgi:hypothetical protein
MGYQGMTRDLLNVIVGLGSLEAAVFVLIFLIIVALGIVIVIEWADRYRKGKLW